MVVVGPDMLVAALTKAGESFAPGELAYLALTSKPELPLRDRLAWVLHSELKGCVVAREWHATRADRARTDLAVLDQTGTKPVALIEAKAAYTFDFAGPERATVAKYRKWVAQDIDKARRAATGESQADLYALLLLTHPRGVPASLPGTVKYAHSIRRALSRRDHHALREQAEQTVIGALETMGQVRAGRLLGGQAFGVEVDVDFWLLGPCA